MTGFELEFSELPLKERWAVPGVVLVLGQDVPDDDRQLARGGVVTSPVGLPSVTFSRAHR